MAEQAFIQLKLPEQTITRTEAKNAFYELRKQAFRRISKSNRLTRNP